MTSTIILNLDLANRQELQTAQTMISAALQSHFEADLTSALELPEGTLTDPKPLSAPAATVTVPESTPPTAASAPIATGKDTPATQVSSAATAAAKAEPSQPGLASPAAATDAAYTAAPAATAPAATSTPSPSIFDAEIVTAPAIAPPAAMTPPPVHTAPVADIAPSVTAPELPSGEVDSRGMPWDARIHASTKSKVSNGNWKNKRGVDEPARVAIEAELTTGLEGVPPKPPIPVPVPPTPPAAVKAPSGAADITTLPQIMTAIRNAGLKTEDVTAACVSVGLANSGLMAGNPQLIPSIAAALGL